MKTGTDISIRECRASGYAVVEHYGKTMKPDKSYWLTISNPAYWPQGCLIPGKLCGNEYRFAGLVSYSDLYSGIKDNTGFKSFVDWENCPYTSPDNGPSFGELAMLAQSIHSYQGLY